VLRGVAENFWALIFPFLLIAGIRSGLFTPSEAGAFAVVYAFLVGVFVYRELTLKKFWQVLKQTGSDIGVIMFIIACAAAFGYAVVTDRLPQHLSQFIIGISSNKYIVLTAILCFLFVIGMFMESTVNVLILVPVFMPIIKPLGVDPVHFGLLFMLVNTMGGMTPPVGTTMYAACSLLECPTDVYTIEAMPYILTVVVTVLILMLFPQIVLFIPNLVFG